MTRPKVVCSQCKGAGFHELTGRLWDTFRRMPVEQWLTTDAVMALHRPRRKARTVVLYRLDTLLEVGLVDRRKNPNGRGLEWMRTE